ncbi:MAG: PQQ-binding-like beta-propeller repeat protein, partial [Pirellulales bacterium]
HPLDPLFYDATSSTLSSDGELVFVVEGNSSPTFRQRLRQAGGSRNNENSNRLVAYDIKQNGQLRWQLPRANNELAVEEPRSRWFLGSPLPLGNELFVLVEERQQIRLDVLSSATGETIWSQPLAEVDVEYDINNRDDRKQLGLSPTFAEGILVCPTGAGAAIAVDLTARTLLWAYRFTIPKPDDVRRLANGIQLRMQVLAGNMAGMQIKSSAAGNTDGGKWLDALPIIAGDRALLTPAGSEFLHCVNIRTGELLWRSPRSDFITVAGITNRMVILLGQKTAAAVSLDDGKIAWKQTIGPNEELVCGRGILSGKRLYVPIDTPAVAEIDTSNGKVVGLSLGRGSSLPGNLVSYRGEVISQGLDSLDVYHQTADLERGVETALKENPNDPWAVSWRGELELDKGDTT